MNHPDHLPRQDTPQAVADQVAQTYFGVTDAASRRRAIRQSLLGAVVALASKRLKHRVM